MARQPFETALHRPCKGIVLQFLLACALLLQGGAVARAAQSDPLNPAPTIDRDRIDRQAPVVKPVPPRVAPAPPAPRVDERAAQAVTLARLRYDGSSLPRARLDVALAPYIGRQLTRETLQRIVDTINTVYQQSDVAFYAITVPRQVVSGGELTVRIVEARISQYAVKGGDGAPTALIGAHMDRLMADRPTHKRALERRLSLLRDIPGQTIDAQLRTVGKPEELALDLRVKSKKIDVALNINNNGVLNVVSGAQAQLSVAVYGLLREGDATRVSGYLPFTPNRYQLYSASHTTPVGADGLALSISGAHVRTLTRDPEIRGRVSQGGVGLSYPLIRSYKRNLALSLSLDGVNSDNYFLDTAFGAFRTRVVRGSASWSAIGKKGGYAVSGTVSQGLDALGARAFAGFSEAGFAKANLQVAGVRDLGKGAAAKLTVRGQYARDKLPTTERFSLGGEGAGLAFRAGTVTAESAVSASVELSKKVLGPATAARGVTVFAYVDAALAHTVARPVYAIPADDFSLASAGGGFRVAPFGSWVASVQVAVPVKRAYPGERGKPRFFFSVSRSV